MSVSKRQLLFQYGVDIDARQILAIGEVSPVLYTRILFGIRHLSAMSPEPITVVINSYGGEVCQALAIIEAMKASPVPVHTHAVGACMSAGAVILQAGAHRSASPDISLMVHFGAETNESGSEASHNAQLTKRMKDIFKERTGRSTKVVNKWFVADTYFTAEQAVREKLIDEVRT